MSGIAGNRDIPGRFPLKATDIREVSVVQLSIAAYGEFGMQVNNRAILNPIFKKYNGVWVDAVGDIDVRYDLQFVNAILRNATDCDLDIIVRVL